MFKNILKKIFFPAVALMSRLWYWQKFLLLMLLFTFSIGFVLYFFLNQINQSIRFSEKEIMGVRYVSPLFTLLQDTQQHRGMASLFLRGDQSFLPRLLEKENKIKGDFLLIYAKDKEFGRELKTTSTLNILENKWMALEKNYTQLTPKESAHKHTEFILELLDMITLVGDTSNLILDPGLDSYYLMNSIINTLPNLSENFGQARAFTLSVQDPNKINDFERRDLVNYINIGDNAGKKIKKDVDIIFDVNNTLRQNIEKPLESLSKSIKSLTDLLNTFIDSSKVEMPLPDYYAFTTDVIDTDFSFIIVLADNLENLLQKRVDELKNQRQINIGISIFVYILILYFFIGFYFLVSRTVRELKNITKELSNGKAKEALILSKDELGEVGESFNMISRAFIISNNENLKKSHDLEDRFHELEQTKKAIVNLLEDIEEDKKKVEGLVIKRTKELSSEKARLLASINSLSFGFIVADMNHNVLLKNKAMTDLFGLKETDTISINHVGELLGENFNIKTQVELCLKDKKVCEIKEIVFGTKFLRGIIAPVVTEKTMIGYVFLLEDITEARTIDKTKTEFVSLASHQLRTPLSAINWYSEMLLSGDAGKLKPEQQGFMEEIITSSKRMSSLVGTLLNVSRIEMGTFPVDPEDIDVCKLVEDEINDLWIQISEKKITLEVVCNLKPAIFSVDPKLMSIVIQNFLTNSIKYNPAEGKITVSIDKDDRDGGVTLSFIDTGYGIPKEDQGRIFSKMYRSDNAKAVDADGNGLGLYMVKTILEASGCKIWFESPPKNQKEGTAFYVHIPQEGMKQKSGTKHLGGIVS